MLTAALALAGFYFYVFIYTRWLKRSTPQNIVIGGAAGAFPPLVGWAAVTNRVDLLAVYLFLIIFYWTPPHFWALALLKQRDYGRAGVPMAPLVWGERETKRQMFWYTLILIPLTLLPYAFGALGLLYLVAATLLGGMFLVGVLRVMRAAEWTKPAWRLYKFSLLYLALLFAAMVVDRVCRLTAVAGGSSANADPHPPLVARQLLPSLIGTSSVSVPPAVTVTLRSIGAAMPSCHTITLYEPGGSESIANLPSLRVTA